MLSEWYYNSIPKWSKVKLISLKCNEGARHDEFTARKETAAQGRNDNGVTERRERLKSRFMQCLHSIH